ncbi:MAG: hypothetical protein H6Q90_673 [Deltaproteobacteria bacterium]|nr:hypothetical protein [Deltaproteobacteria bacterium]
MRRLRSLTIVLGLGGCSTSKQDWFEKFEELTVDGFCAPTQYFRQCFEIDEAGCRKLASETIHACGMKTFDQLPDRLDRADGEKFGRIIGSCAGGEYDRRMAAQGKRHGGGKCDDPTAWVP